MTTTTSTRGTLLAILALLLAAAMAAATLVPGAAQAAPGKANPSKACSERGDTIYGEEGEPPSTHGGCASFEASGKLTGAGYSAQCKNLTGGEYPFTFYGQFTVDNHGECVNTLRGFHTTPPPPVG